MIRDKQTHRYTDVSPAALQSQTHKSASFHHDLEVICDLLAVFNFKGHRIRLNLAQSSAKQTRKGDTMLTAGRGRPITMADWDTPAPTETGRRPPGASRRRWWRRADWSLNCMPSQRGLIFLIHHKLKYDEEWAVTRKGWVCNKDLLHHEIQASSNILADSRILWDFWNLVID